MPRSALMSCAGRVGVDVNVNEMVPIWQDGLRTIAIAIKDIDGEEDFDDVDALESEVLPSPPLPSPLFPQSMR